MVSQHKETRCCFYAFPVVTIFVKLLNLILKQDIFV